ncbi:MAG TPA: molybdopterin converting factor subunit 1 [Opitutaceae bacterium]|nr:molybdopterin converting factor subunit 1 [Opitutaceae bacterium]
MPAIHVQYFAILREQRGLAQEELVVTVATAGELYEQLRQRHRFTLPLARIRVAVNDEFVSAETTLRDHDRVVFIPPVAGG